jgi:hypothetical protein
MSLERIKIRGLCIIERAINQIYPLRKPEDITVTEKKAASSISHSVIVPQAAVH